MELTKNVGQYQDGFIERSCEHTDKVHVHIFLGSCAHISRFMCTYLEVQANIGTFISTSG